MKTIWKFPLQVLDRQRIEMPKGAEILTAQRQGDGACLWAVVDVDDGSTTEMRTIDIYATGYPMPSETDKRSYIGTFQAAHLVWHVFEAKEQK